MSILKVLTYPDKRLAEKSELVTEFNAELKKNVNDMIETMYDQGGVGLAAPQVGILKRFVVIDVSEKQQEPIVLINPEIIAQEGTLNEKEGCLSVPDYSETVKRHAKVKVRAQDLQGQTFELEGEGLLSRCIQHELDHLEGILFIDRGSAFKKQLFRRWFKKHQVLSSEKD